MAKALKKVRVSMMNAIHDLPLLVARDEGFFRDEGLDVDILKTPGSGQRDSDHQALRENIFERTMEALYDQGQCDQFRMCEWGVMKGAVAAASLMEPWISVAEKRGMRVLMESHSTRSEAAGDELDGPTLAAMFRAEARAADAIDRDPREHARYLIEEAGGLLDAKELKVSRLLNAPPEPYTRERFDHTHQWTLGWGLVQSGATFENTVDNRAWQ